MELVKLNRNEAPKKLAKDIKACPDHIIQDVLKRAFEEDLGLSGDLSGLYFIDQDARRKVALVSRQDGCVAGLDIAGKAFKFIDDTVLFDKRLEDGDLVKKGDVLAVIEGNARSILAAERTALNILTHLSGIASYTNELTNLISNHKAKLLDTRKTLPGLRALQKYAVRVGGGVNHRFGLNDAVMIKDNHIAFMSSLKEAVTSAREKLGPLVKIEIEIDRLDQLDDVLDCRPDVIMLDNMPPEILKQAVTIINGHAITEASGNIKAETIEAVAASGVDYISCGALTHSVQNFDIGLDDFSA
ncbi:MAG: nicotinate-nucleotide diphosphorylase (carboxylating) [Rickettsiales bacterium]|nr:nicotinate-nucleotide diphosphorylase (carboxylating) [Rickettsiales bacterium]